MVTRLLAGALLASSASGLPVNRDPTERPASLRTLVETPDISGVSLSPDGRVAVYRLETPSIERNTVVIDWYAVPTDASSQPRRISSGGEPIVSDNGTLLSEQPQWSPDSRHLFFRALIDGEVQVWRAAIDGTDTRRVTNGAADVDRFSLIGNGALIISVGATREEIRSAEKREYDEGIVLDQTIDPGQAIFRGAIINGRHATQRLTGDWFDRRGLLAGRPPHFLAVDARASTSRPATAREIALFETARASATALNAAPATTSTDRESGLVATLSAGENAPGIAVTDPADRSPSLRCPTDLCGDGRIQYAAWLPGRAALAIARLDKARATEIVAWTPRTGAVRTLAKGDAMLAGDWRSITPCAFGRDTALCVAASAGVPPRLEAISLSSGVRTILTVPSGNQGRHTFVRMDWRSRDGLVFTGQYLAPKLSALGRRAPLFITYNGCVGYLRGGAGDEWPLAAMADAGIAALCIDAGDPPSKRYDAVSSYRVALDGVRGAIDRLDRDGVIDRRRVGMGGLSFGTETTAWVLVHSDLLAAASLSSVLMEPAYYWFNVARNGNIRQNLKSWWKLGAPDETPARWREISPALNTARIDAPILFQIPEQEYRYNLELVSRLIQQDKPIEMIIFPDEAHVKFQPRHKLAVYQRNLDWFRFWLQGYVRPDGPLEQYKRWSAMRRDRQARLREADKS